MIRDFTRMIGYFWSDLHKPSLLYATIGTALLGLSIIIGSRNLQNFDAMLIGYCLASLFAFFGLVYRYSVWISKPPTWKYWVRGWQMFFSPSMWRNLRAPRVLSVAVLRKLIIQDFVWRRGWDRWVGHMLIAVGCAIAFAITFPLVFGWVHFEMAPGIVDGDHKYIVSVFGFHASELPHEGIFSWFVFHGLVVASFLVIPGVMLAMYRRMRNPGAVAVQRFARDFLPLILIFAMAFTGLLLWVSYEWLEGYFFVALAQLHAWTVIAFLLSLPFGKLFHIFQRPATIGISFYRAVNADREPAVCPVTKEPFAPKMQTDDLKEVLGEMEFDYSGRDESEPAWNEISPRGRRMLIARAHSKARGNKFD